MQGMDELRSQIETIDREIVELVGRRLDVALAIGKTKNHNKLPIRDYRVEKAVVKRIEDAARAAEVKKETAKALARILIEASVAIQEGISDRSVKPSRGKALVAGGRGKMGAWFCRYLHTLGFDVHSFDPAGPAGDFAHAPDLAKGVEDAELVIIAAPLTLTPGVLKEVLALRPAGVVLDIASLKSEVTGIARKGVEHGLAVTSLHPMFGPDAQTLMDRNVILCSCGCERADDFAASLFEGTAANLVRITPEEHDAKMTWVLGASHALNLVFMDMLSRSETPLSGFEEVASTTFLKQIRTTRDVAFELGDLYFDIQSLNPHTAALFASFAESVDRLFCMVDAGDSARFSGMMEDARKWFVGE